MDRVNVGHDAYEAGRTPLGTVIEGQRDALGAGTAYKGAGRTFKGAGGSALGALQIGFGREAFLEGVERGDPSMALSGGLDVVGGGASMLAPVAPALGPVGAATTAFNTSKAITEHGMARSKWDRPGWAADKGLQAQDYVEGSWLDKALAPAGGREPGARSGVARFIGGAATLGASIPEAAAAFGEGLWAVGEDLVSPIRMPDPRTLDPGTASLELPVHEDVRGTGYQVWAPQEAPPPAPATPRRRARETPPVPHRETDRLDYSSPRGTPRHERHGAP
jgi:hypothetical protein